ncbi:ABC-2 transporter permease [Microbacterium sp. G2-8]|uniref:ABC-2 transporter permease n=1 Tax=Microbacterium sp. G2-8 TaxID=2842454 RepID=UPI001C88ED74|nr:ABC-2 transporter permease [Microbacterium sp. G2-8]
MISTFTRLDLSSWFLRAQTILTLALVAAVGVLLPVPGMAIMASAAVTSLMVSAPFLGDERGRLDALYGVLPLSRNNVVVGRTLSILVYYLVSVALAIIVTFASARVRGAPFDSEILLIAGAASLAFVGLSMALQLPVFFRVGYSRGRLMAYAPVFVVAGSAWLLQATGSHVNVLGAFAGLSIVGVASIGALIGVIGVTCGLIAAARLYRVREL